MAEPLKIGAVRPARLVVRMNERVDRYGDDIVIAFETRIPKRMAPACERVRAGVLDASLSYGGPLAARLEQHVGNLVVRDTPYGDAATKQHPDSPKRIDGAVAAIIAYDRALWHASEGPPREPMVAYG